MFVKHYKIIDTSPNESDGEGTWFVACGKEEVVVATTNLSKVTCSKYLEKVNLGDSK